MMEIKLEYWIYFSVHCNSKILFFKNPHTQKNTKVNKSRLQDNSKLNWELGIKKNN